MLENYIFCYISYFKIKSEAGDFSSKPSTTLPSFFLPWYVNTTIPSPYLHFPVKSFVDGLSKFCTFRYFRNFCNNLCS